MANDGKILALPGGAVPILGSTKQIELSVIQGVLETLGNAFGYHKANDDMLAAKNCSEEVRYSPLTQRLAVTAGALAQAAGLAEVKETPA